jgi:hypothetical protein
MQFKSLGEGVAFVIWMNIQVPYESTSSSPDHVIYVRGYMFLSYCWNKS